MTTVQTEETTCPVCSAKLEVRHIMSTNNFGGQDTDFRSHPVGFDPLHLVMATCTTCGYSDYSRYFTEPRDLDDRVKERIRGTLQPEAGETIKPSTGYIHAARIAGWRGAGYLEIADLYLKAAWCCADEGSDEDEIIYRTAAIEHFEQALAHEDLEATQRPVLTYLVGELYRRVGQPEQAREWFDKVLAMDDLAEDLAWLQPTAQQQRDEPKEKFR